MSDPKGVKTVFYAATVSQMAGVQLRLLGTCEETDSARRAVAARRQRDGETPEGNHGQRSAYRQAGILK